MAPPPQEGVVDQSEVIAACLRSQARARGQVYKGAPAVSAAAIACVLSLISFSPRHARQCRCVLNCSPPTSFRARKIRPPVRQLAFLTWTVCALQLLPFLEAGRLWGVVRVSDALRQTVAPPGPPHLQQAGTLSDSISLLSAWHPCICLSSHRYATCDATRSQAHWVMMCTHCQHLGT